MRSYLMTGALVAAALAWAPGARGDDVAKAKADAQHDVNQAQADAAKQKADAQRDAQKKQADADRKVQRAEQKANDKVSGAERKDAQDARGTPVEKNDRMAAYGDKSGNARRSVFEGKDNFQVKGRVQQVGKNEVTVARDDLPPVKLHVEGWTKIEVDGNRASFGNLAQGQDVKASFNLQGDRPVAVELKADRKK